MLTPFDVASDVLCPSLRAIVTNKLIKLHRFTQQEAASRLGLTQQAVSNYATGLRGVAKDLSKKPEVEEWAERISQAVARGADRPDVAVMLVEACDNLLRRRVACGTSRGSKREQQERSCTLCGAIGSECPLQLWPNLK